MYTCFDNTNFVENIYYIDRKKYDKRKYYTTSTM